jgi:hypothetical protein
VKYNKNFLSPPRTAFNNQQTIIKRVEGYFYFTGLFLQMMEDITGGRIDTYGFRLRGAYVEDVVGNIDR